MAHRATDLRGACWLPALVVAVAMLAPGTAAAATYGAERVADINRAGSLSNQVMVGNVLYFAHGDDAHGLELWKSDGTAAGTVMVKDCNPGNRGSAPFNLTNVNGVLYFDAHDATHAIELWKSDGTEAGTMMVKDIYPTLLVGTSDPEWLTAVGSTLFFAANDSVHGRELWKSDGTAAGTVMVKDINTGAADANLSGLVNVNGVLFFIADDGVHGFQVWKSDGTTAGTVMVSDGTPTGSPGYQNYPPVAIGSQAFFVGSSGSSPFGGVLWKSDGTTAGTGPVPSPTSGGGGVAVENSLLVVVNGKVAFVGSVDFISGPVYRVCTSDGTAAGTTELNGGGAPLLYPQPLAAGNGKLWIANSPDTTYESSLWVSDGTSAGTVMVKHFPSSFTTGGLNLVSYLVAAGPRLFFVDNDGIHGAELWTSDGTDAGTHLVRDINVGSTGANTVNVGSNGVDVHYLTAAGSGVYFYAYDGYAASGLWFSDGSEVGTALVAKLDPGTSGSSPVNLAAVGQRVLFQGADGIYPTRLWASDGTATGTVPLAGTPPGSGGNWDPAYLTTVNGLVFFSPNESAQFTFWKSDGTPAGTAKVSDRVRFTAGKDPGFVAFKNKVWFIANTPGLWCSDGTDAGTIQVSPSGPGALTPLVPCGNQLYFSVIGPNEGLWKTDGTTAGTVQVKSISVGSSLITSSLTAMNGLIYFFSADAATGMELWRSDGTDAGTFMVKDAKPGNDGLLYGEIVAANGTLFFTYVGYTGGLELWKSDGTAAGTVLVKSINPTYGVSLFPNTLVSLGDRVMFVADDGTHGRALWTSDGTTAGTRWVRGADRRSTPYTPVGMTAINGKAYFSGNDGWFKEEPWVSDGTDAGTVMIKDVWPGGAGSQPSGFTATSDGTVYFAAADPVGGRELWKVTDGSEEVALAIAPSRNDSVASAPIIFTCTFSAPVTGFTIDDLVIANGSAAAFSGSGAVYTVQVTPAAAGQVVVATGYGAAHGLGGAPSQAGYASVVYDPSLPVPTLATAASDPTTTSPIPVTATFSAAVTGFSAAGVTVSNGTVGGFAGSGAAYSFTVTPTVPGLVTVAIPTNVATDSAAHANVASVPLARTYLSSGTALSLQINFQPAQAPVFPGYAVDSGAVFGDRGNGRSYGWNAANPHTRDRNLAASPDQRYDTFNHLQDPANPDAVWEVQVPNGSYSVRLVAGDALYANSVFRLDVEGVLVLSGTPTAANRWIDSGVQPVVVGDGRLTVSNGAGAVNNKLCFIEIGGAVYDLGTIGPRREDQQARSIRATTPPDREWRWLDRHEDTAAILKR